MPHWPTSHRLQGMVGVLSGKPLVPTALHSELLEDLTQAREAGLSSNRPSDAKDLVNRELIEVNSGCRCQTQPVRSVAAFIEGKVAASLCLLSWDWTIPEGCERLD